MDKATISVINVLLPSGLQQDEADKEAFGGGGEATGAAPEPHEEGIGVRYTSEQR